MPEPVLPRVYVDLTGRIRSHLKKIRAIPKKQPEYTVALVIAIASEGLSQLRNKPKHAVFTKLLRRHCDVPEVVALGLFDAVRNGLAHCYDTALIEVSSKETIVVVIRWNNRSQHLRVERRVWLKDGVPRLGVSLDMETMWWDLLRYLRETDEELRGNRQLAKQVVKRGRQLDSKYTVRRTRIVEEATESIRRRRQIVAKSSVEEWQQGWQQFLKDRLLGNPRS